MPAISVNYVNKKLRNGILESDFGTRTAADEDDECGVQLLTPKLRGGELAEIDEFPWMALLFYESRKLNENSI